MWQCLLHYNLLKIKFPKLADTLIFPETAGACSKNAANIYNFNNIPIIRCCVLNAYVGAEEVACALDSIMFVFSCRLACDHPNYLSELTQETVIKVSGKNPRMFDLRSVNHLYSSVRWEHCCEIKRCLWSTMACATHAWLATPLHARTNADLFEQCTIFTFRREKPRFPR